MRFFVQSLVKNKPHSRNFSSLTTNSLDYKFLSKMKKTIKDDIRDSQSELTVVDAMYETFNSQQIFTNSLHPKLLKDALCAALPKDLGNLTQAFSQKQDVLFYPYASYNGLLPYFAPSMDPIVYNSVSMAHDLSHSNAIKSQLKWTEYQMRDTDPTLYRILDRAKGQLQQLETVHGITFNEEIIQTIEESLLNTNETINKRQFDLLSKILSNANQRLFNYTDGQKQIYTPAQSDKFLRKALSLVGKTLLILHKQEHGDLLRQQFQLPINNLKNTYRN